MKQIVVNKVWSKYSNYEVKDFLREIHHSPEWIGCEENWIIRSMQVANDKLGNPYITALLENPDWVAPEVKAMTGNELYEAIKQYPDAKVAIAKLSGVCGMLGTLDDSKCLSNSFKSGHNVLIFAGKDELKVKQLLEEIGHEPEPEDTMKFALWYTGEENRKELAAMPIAIRIGERSETAYPLTGVRYENRELILIYNQDVEI